MSNGTFVTVKRYYNHYHLHSIDELQREREKAKESLESYWSNVKALMLATPKDIVPTNEEPETYIDRRAEELRFCIETVEYKIQALDDIEQGWDTKTED